MFFFCNYYQCFYDLLSIILIFFLLRLREDKTRVSDELRKAKLAREVVDDKLDKFEVEKQSLIEMQEALKVRLEFLYFAKN